MNRLTPHVSLTIKSDRIVVHGATAETGHYHNVVILFDQLTESRIELELFYLQSRNTPNEH